MEQYQKYLDSVIEPLLKKFFEQQKDYIKCKPGCSFCCETGEYPFSKLELEYAMIGYNLLEQNEKTIIDSNINEIKKQKESFEGDIFLYKCPFLINQKCSIYEHRALICRTHGLIFYIEKENGEHKSKAPACMDIGLNYSGVYDSKEEIISLELWKKTGIETEPVSYNMSRKAIIENPRLEKIGVDFGESKALIDWF